MSNEDFEKEEYGEVITPETDEPSFAEELENYLPTPENTDKMAYFGCYGFCRMRGSTYHILSADFPAY